MLPDSEVLPSLRHSEPVLQLDWRLQVVTEIEAFLELLGL